MKFTSLELNGLALIEPEIFTDERGYFFESYHQKKFAEAGLNFEFVQDNESLSNKSILRGLHFQHPPYAQGKLVRVMHGAVLDVVIDIRKNSPTCGKHFKIELNDRNHYMLWIPPGFAHGFLALEDKTVFCYQCTEFYNKQAESGILWNDAELAINWGIDNPVVSAKDQQLSGFSELKSLY